MNGISKALEAKSQLDEVNRLEFTEDRPFGRSSFGPIHNFITKILKYSVNRLTVKDAFNLLDDGI